MRRILAASLLALWPVFHLPGQPNDLPRDLDEIPEQHRRPWLGPAERAWLEPLAANEQRWTTLAVSLFELRWYREAATLLEVIHEGQGRTAPILQSSARRTKLYLAKCWVWFGRYREAETLLRGLHKECPDTETAVEYAGLLTGTVREADGKLYYLPGLGHDRESARKGIELWRVTGLSSGSRDWGHVYLRLCFHVILFRWVQGYDKAAKKSIGKTEKLWQRSNAWNSWKSNRRFPDVAGICISRDVRCHRAD